MAPEDALGVDSLIEVSAWTEMTHTRGGLSLDESFGRVILSGYETRVGIKHDTWVM